MSNDLDPDQDRRSVGPDLGPNCLQKLSADCKITSSKERQYGVYKASKKKNRCLFEAVSLADYCLFDLILDVPVNNFSVILGRVFMG